MFFILKRFSTRIILKLKLSIKGFVKNSVFSLLPTIFLRGILCSLFLLLLVMSCKENPTDSSKPPKPPGYQEDIPWPSLANSPWPMFHGNPQNNGRSRYKGPDLNNILWSKLIPGVKSTIGFTPFAIGEDSTLYFGSSYEPDSIIGQRSYLYAVDIEGNIKWKYQFRGAEVASTPIVTSFGLIYIGVYDGYLYAIRTDGKLEWEFFAGSITLEGINIDKEGSVYFLNFDGRLFSIDKHGLKKWELYVDGGFLSSPSNGIGFSPDGNYLYVSGNIINGSKTLYKVDKNGNIIWYFDNNKLLIMTPAIDSDGNIYFGCKREYTSQQLDPEFICLGSDSKIKWSITIDINYPTPAIDKFGNIYITANKNDDGYPYLYCIEYTGKTAWFNQALNPQSAIVCDKESFIYYLESNRINKTNSQGININSLQLNEAGYSCPAIGYGCIYFSLFGPDKKVGLIK